MAARKAVPTGASVKNDGHRDDAAIVVRMMAKASGRHANGEDVTICKIRFSPQAQALTFYLGNSPERARPLKMLGKHKTSSGGCLYIDRLEDVDTDVLQEMMKVAYHTNKNGNC